MRWWLMFEIVIEAYRWFFLRLADVVGLGWGIVALSFITSAAMMPLMKLVAGVVRRETEYQSVILPQLADIKSRYSSDAERHAHIQRLYRRYGYSPLSAVKKVLPLFVQIPFLLLTYFMLKDTAELQGVSFLFLRDLGKPDGLLRVLDVNLLPIAMTMVNLLTVVATPGFTRKDNVQAVSISLLFLLLLYTAPSALLLYWTLNNVITMFRTLCTKRGEGARLLCARLGGLRGLPLLLRERLTDRNLAIVGLVALIVALYMRLMVYMQLWFFNYMVSYWLMVEVLAVALVSNALVRRKSHLAVRLSAWIAACASIFAAVLLVVVLAMLPITTKGVMFVNAHCDLAVVFDVLFYLGMVPVLLEIVMYSREAVASVASGFSKEWHWLIGVIILSIHYSFASANFKLPICSVALLTVYLVLPALVAALLLALVFFRDFDARKTFRVGVGVALGAYLIPMVSLESGKILGWSSNLLVRFVLIGGMAYFVGRIRKRKPVLVFLVILVVLVVANVAVSKICADGETTSNMKAAEGSEVRKALLNAPCAHTNSIYLLVYDGYMPDAILDGMKVKSIGMGAFLRKYGFVSYDAYSVGCHTIASMGSTFNIGGVVQGSYRSSMAGDNVFCDYLRRFGYKTSYVLCGYDMPNRGERMPGDFYFPTAQKVTRPEMVLYPCIIRGILSQSANTFNSYTRKEWLSVKRDLMASAPAAGNFIYAHSEMPGHVAPNPAYRKDPETERRSYEDRVALADKELQEDMGMLLAKNDDSIIIVASDHGSHLSLPTHDNEYDAFTLLDRVGVQLHVRWPHDYKPCLKLNCLQNLFLEIEIYLSGDKSLARFAVPGETLYIQAPLRAPAGAIVGGVIQSGQDKGCNLFEAAKRRAHNGP